MVTLDKIKSISKDDNDIGRIYGHYEPLADLINKNNFKNIIEIGCAYGNLAEYLLNNTNLEKLYSIDPYTAYPDMPGLESQEDYDILYNYVSEKLSRYSERFRLFKCTSDQFIKNYWNENNDEYNWDMAFIDGLHEYNQVKKDIENYGALLRPNSILSGHDVTVFEGVDKAVHEYQKVSGKKLHILKGNIWYFKF